MILFHRPYYERESGSKNRFSLAIDKYDIKESDSIEIHFKGYWKGVPIEDTFIIPYMEKGSVYELWYNSNNCEPILKNYRIINPHSATFGFVYDTNLIYFGRIHFEKNDILLYLSGRYKDVEGVTNIIIKDGDSGEGGESSPEAMCRYSDEAKKVFKEVDIKKKFLNKVDPLDSIAYLETQLDSLTEAFLDYISNHSISEKDKSILNKALNSSVFTIKSDESAYEEMDNKAKFRSLQKEFYENKA